MNTTNASSALKMPKVSIGMPVYNGEPVIRDALDSLLGQKYADFELIISDNASTDATEAICREYAAIDPRILYVRQDQNKGGLLNFEFVLHQAVGEYFMWAAHDDKWSNTFLTNAISVLNDKDCDFAFPSFQLESIYFRISKSCNMSIFDFIESRDRKVRVLNFLALHHSSHKCNIVYSLFRKDFLTNCCKIQNISNDGALGSVILNNGRGGFIKNAIFFKRYSWIWPGFLDVLHNIINNNETSEFISAKNESIALLTKLFPEYASSIECISSHYKQFDYNKNFKIFNL
jgi:glycosyltransferase involved in cell wall biosynthesis